MFDAVRRLVLRVARVPEAPHPPYGAPDSLRVFRAGRNLYRLTIVRWLLAQVATLVGILFSLNFLDHLKDDIRAEREQPPAVVAPLETEAEPRRDGPRWRQGHDELTRQIARNVGQHTPSWALPLMLIGEAIGIALYLLQLPVTFAALRLEYEMRWYMVTDRSLRIRHGIMSVRESTMSFANLQQVEVSQGPLQRLLGLADVRVQSAGGGGGNQREAHGKGAAESLHTGVFTGVDNAEEIRDLIIDRLRRYRAAGLGDPDDASDAVDADALPIAAEPSTQLPAAIEAARSVLHEARALRVACSR